MTEKLHALLDEQIIAQLTIDGFPQPAKVVERVRCIQSGVPGYAAGEAAGVTDTPTAFDIGLSGEIATAVAFDILRGGMGAPDNRPYLEVFRRNSGHWESAGSIGSDFTGHWLFVRPIQAGRPQQKWFLLWGAQFGEGNAPLRMAVAAYDGNSLSEIWAKDLPAVGTVEISGDHVIVSGEDTNEKGRAEDFEDLYKAVPGGLEFVSRRITKSY